MTVISWQNTNKLVSSLYSNYIPKIWVSSLNSKTRTSLLRLKAVKTLPDLPIRKLYQVLNQSTKKIYLVSASLINQSIASRMIHPPLKWDWQFKWKDKNFHWNDTSLKITQLLALIPVLQWSHKDNLTKDSKGFL